MSDALAGLLGALVGGAAAIGGAILQTRTAARNAKEQRTTDEAKVQEEREREAMERRQALARRYLFGLQDSTESLRRRLQNWADEGGRPVAERVDPGYWDVTTLYAVARALAAERILALEAVYPALDVDFPELADTLKTRGVERALEEALGERVLRYHRLTLAEAALERESDEYRVLVFSEFRHRYDDDRRWGLKRLLEPARDAITDLTPDQMRSLKKKLDDLVKQLEAVTRVPRPSQSDQGTAA